MIDTMTLEEIERMDYLRFLKEKGHTDFTDERQWELEELERRHEAMVAKMKTEKPSKSKVRRVAAQKKAVKKTIKSSVCFVLETTYPDFVIIGNTANF